MRTFGTELYMPVLVLLMTCQAGAGSGKKVTTSLLTGGLMVGVHASTRTPSLRIQYGQSRIHCEKWRVGQVCACGVDAECRPALQDTQDHQASSRDDRPRYEGRIGGGR